MAAQLQSWCYFGSKYFYIILNSIQFRGPFLAPANVSSGMCLMRDAFDAPNSSFSSFSNLAWQKENSETVVAETGSNLQ